MGARLVATTRAPSPIDEGGNRVRRTFNTLAEAKTEAKIVATRLDQADALALQLTGAGRQQYLLAAMELRPLGIPLHLEHCS